MLRRNAALLARVAANSLQQVEYSQRAWWLNADVARQCQPIRIPHATVTTWMRSWASDSKQGEQQENNQTPTEEAPELTQGDAAAEEAAPEADPKDEEIARYKEEVASLKDKLVRLLADMENLRERSARQVESAHKFAIQGFVKDFLEVPDTLERALQSVQEVVSKQQGEASSSSITDGLQGLDQDKAVKLLGGLVEGIELTDKIMMQIFGKNGVERMQCTLGDKFDPNLHNAMFELPDPSKDPGTVAHVVKTGYLLHGRVVRPASVGVVRAP